MERHGRQRKYRGEVISWVKSSVHVLFGNLLSRGERGRKGSECKFQNKAHRTFDPSNTFSPVDVSVTSLHCSPATLILILDAMPRHFAHFQMHFQHQSPAAGHVSDAGLDLQYNVKGFGHPPAAVAVACLAPPPAAASAAHSRAL